MEKTEKINQVIKPFIEEMGLEVVDIEYLQEGGYWFVRIYIEKFGGEDVDLDECEKLSRAIEDPVDEIIENKFFLEVSSPGLERPLKKESDYERFKSKKACLRLHKKLNELKKYEGIITGFIDGKVLLDIGEDTIEVPFANIKKANLVFDFGDC